MRYMVCIEGTPDFPSAPKAVVEVGACEVQNEPVAVVFNYNYTSEGKMGKATNFTREEKDGHAELYFDIEFDDEMKEELAKQLEVGVYLTRIEERKGEDGLRHIHKARLSCLSFFIGPEVGKPPRWKDFV